MLVVYAELFPTRIRTVGVGVPYSTAVATFGGPAPYLQTRLGESFGPSWFTGHVVVMLLVSAVAIASAPRPGRGTSPACGECPLRLEDGTGRCSQEVVRGW